jgi:ribosomal protein L12E/L44/L45/RPP1/RPP2
MPLDKSGTKEARGRNIAELIHAGHKPSQAIAISYSVEREHKEGHKERHDHEKNKYGR